jgi:hypothetical protein
MPLGKTEINYFSDPEKFYRVVRGQDVIDDIIESGKIRTIGSPTYKGTNPHLSDHPSLAERIKSRPTAWPSFAKGKVNLEYAKGSPDHYIIETEEKLMTPSRGRHSPGSTYFPTDEAGNPTKEFDAKKTKIFKHVGDGQYETVRLKGAGLGKYAADLAGGLVRGLAEAPKYEFLNPPSAGPSDPNDPIYQFERGLISQDEFIRRLKE